MPSLRKQLAQQRDLLAALAGQFPGQSLSEQFLLSSLQLPDQLPVSLPSQLVAQRPDVLQAEANLHAASAQVGIAIANRLPNIELTANAGSSALAISAVLFTLAHELSGSGRNVARSYLFRGRLAASGGRRQAPPISKPQNNIAAPS